MGVPDYLRQPLANWLEGLIRSNHLIRSMEGVVSLEPDDLSHIFVDHIRCTLREKFPNRIDHFLQHVFKSSDRAITVIQYCLYAYADKLQADSLEEILDMGGSGYSVIEIGYHEGTQQPQYDLVERVPPATKQMAQKALDQNERLLKAWRSCYGVRPDYHTTVRESQNVLEATLCQYFPKDKKPQLGKLIANIRDGKKNLKIRGDDVLGDPNTLLDLLKNIPKYRGMHPDGDGLDPGKEQAEYILYTTIYLWSLHETKT